MIRNHHKDDSATVAATVLTWDATLTPFARGVTLLGGDLNNALVGTSCGTGNELR